VLRDLKKEYDNGNSLDHPNILKLHSIAYDKEMRMIEDGSVQTLNYIEMEPCLGGELFDVVAETGKFDDRYARKIFR